MPRSILVVDDETSILTSLKGALEDEGYQVDTVESGAAALTYLQKQRPNIVLLDIWMPGMDGLQTLQEIKKKFSDQSVLMMSGHGTIETAVKATKLGAYDFIEKPLSLEKLLVLLQNALQTQDLARENIALRKQVKEQALIVGESPEMTKIKDIVKRAAPTTGSVLITGENGTGKEVVAQSIHALSDRFNKPFVAVNCAAIPEELIESELFGHEKGAFTGATQLKRGKFDLAHEGTLFLDEIGDMSLKTQAKILRILQEQKFERVGGSQTLSTDVRIVAATNKNLQEEIKAGNFREDLFYRLNVVPIQVPALRERRADIKNLASHFLKHFAQMHSRPPRELSPEAMKALEGYSWPGNVRELKNLIERIYILGSPAEDGVAVSPATIFDHLPNDVQPDKDPLSDESSLSAMDSEKDLPKDLRNARSQFEKEFIERTLKEQGWNVSRAASVLGIERSHLHKKMKSFGIEAKPD